MATVENERIIEIFVWYNSWRFDKFGEESIILTNFAHNFGLVLVTEHDGFTNPEHLIATASEC